MSFKIGQKIVAIKNFANAPIKKGDIRTANGLMTCLCGNPLVDVGIVHEPGSVCACCDRDLGRHVAWFDTNLFRAIDYAFGEMVAESITKECESEKETVKEVIELHQ